MSLVAKAASSRDQLTADVSRMKTKKLVETIKSVVEINVKKNCRSTKKSSTSSLRKFSANISVQFFGIIT